MFLVLFLFNSSLFTPFIHDPYEIDSEEEYSNDEDVKPPVGGLETLYFTRGLKAYVEAHPELAKPSGTGDEVEFLRNWMSADFTRKRN
eukprot:UN14798